MKRSLGSVYIHNRVRFLKRKEMVTSRQGTLELFSPWLAFSSLISFEWLSKSFHEETSSSGLLINRTKVLSSWLARRIPFNTESWSAMEDNSCFKQQSFSSIKWYFPVIERNANDQKRKPFWLWITSSRLKFGRIGNKSCRIFVCQWFSNCWRWSILNCDRKQR